MQQAVAYATPDARNGVPSELPGASMTAAMSHGLKVALPSGDDSSGGGVTKAAAPRTPFGAATRLEDFLLPGHGRSPAKQSRRGGRLSETEHLGGLVDGSRGAGVTKTAAPRTPFGVATGIVASSLAIADFLGCGRSPAQTGGFGNG